MGSALGPYLANLFMSQFDRQIADERPLYFRYVDDILTAVRKSDLPDLLNNVNQLHPSLKFTHEKLMVALLFWIS